MRKLIVVLAFLPGVAAAQRTFISPPSRAERCVVPQRCSMLGETTNARGNELLHVPPSRCLSTAHKAAHIVRMGVFGAAVGVYLGRFGGGTNLRSAGTGAMAGLAVGTVLEAFRPSCRRAE